MTWYGEDIGNIINIFLQTTININWPAISQIGCKFTNLDILGCMIIQENIRKINIFHHKKKVSLLMDYWRWKWSNHEFDIIITILYFLILSEKIVLSILYLTFYKTWDACSCDWIFGFTVVTIVITTINVKEKMPPKEILQKTFSMLFLKIVFKRTQNGITSGVAIMLRPNIVNRIWDSNPKYHWNIYRLI